MTNTTPYKILKNDILPLLYEDKDSFFYYIAQKKLNQKENLKSTLLSILDDTKEAMSFYDIVRHLINADDVDTLTQLTLSEKVSSSKKAILCGYDSCLTCKKDTACQRMLAPLEYRDKVNFLIYTRFVRAKKILRMLKWGIKASGFNVLLREPLLMKFVANYALVVDTKNELKKESSIKNHKTLYKGAGKYCPFNDIYEKA